MLDPGKMTFSSGVRERLHKGTLVVVPVVLSLKPHSSLSLYNWHPSSHHFSSRVQDVYLSAIWYVNSFKSMLGFPVAFFSHQGRIPPDFQPKVMWALLLAWG